MARKCVFCGNKATTNEHLWGEKIIEKVFDKPARGAFTTVERHGRGQIFGGGDYSVENLHSYTSDKPRQTIKICGTCNHGWMSDLESECGNLVVRMARGETVLIDGKAQFALARYAMKTAITHDAAYRSRNRGPVVPEEDIRLLVDDQHLSPRTSVHLFAYDGPRATSYRGIPTTVRFGSPTAPEVPAFRVTLLLTHLVFQVLGYTGTQQRPLEYTRKSSNFRIQIFPPTSIGAVAWPPRYALGDATLEELALRGNFFLRYPSGRLADFPPIARRRGQP